MKAMFTGLLLLPFIISCGQKVAETKKFEFHNNVFTNLHHFLYQKANGSQDKYISIPEENEAFKNLDGQDRNIIDSAIAYYKRKVIDRDLLFDKSLYQFKCQLLNRIETEHISGTSEIEIEDVLNNCLPVYRQHFWPIHQTQNIGKIEAIIKTVSTMEEAFFVKIKKLAGEEWPLEKIIVDVCVYTKWGGAYTGLAPNTTSYSSADTRYAGPYGIEILFHEASHLILWPGAPLIKQLQEAAAKSNRTLPKDYWHVILFYSTGVLTQDFLAGMQIQHPTIYMEKESVFARYLTSGFKSYLKAYKDGNITREQLVDQLVKEL